MKHHNARPRVLLTSPIHPDMQALLAAECDIILAPDTQASTYKRLIRDVHGVIVRNQLPPDIFEDAPLTHAVVRHGVGLDMIPVQAATKKDSGREFAGLQFASGCGVLPCWDACLATQLSRNGCVIEKRGLGQSTTCCRSLFRARRKYARDRGSWLNWYFDLQDGPWTWDEGSWSDASS